jgi:hypothetical protein
LKKIEQTSNFNITELHIQKSICGSASGESKNGCSSFSFYNFLLPVLALTEKWGEETDLG